MNQLVTRGEIISVDYVLLDSLGPLGVEQRGLLGDS